MATANHWRNMDFPLCWKKNTGGCAKSLSVSCAIPYFFGKRWNSLPRVTGEIPTSAQDALEHLLPERGLDYRIASRVAGLGSLGRIRLVALADCNGGKVAREAKALAPSAVYWAHGADQPELLYQVIINRAVRSPDPFVQMRGRWIVRRLSPHCCRIELSVLPKGRDELRLLFAMGWETANIHLGSRSAVKRSASTSIT